MMDHLERLVVAACYLWAAIEILCVGERSSRVVRGLIGAGAFFGFGWWVALAIVNPNPEQYVPAWTITSRVAPILITVGVAVMARRRREINGYH